MRFLTPEELASYDVIDRALAARVRVVRTPLLPPGIGGMTLGRLVLVRRDDQRDGRRALLAHELVHVGQFARLGAVRFLAGYLRHYVAGLVRLRSHRAAYLAIPAEDEARAATRRWVERRREASRAPEP